MSIKIVTDTGCDLPAAQVQQHDIHLVPLILRLGNQEMLDSEASRDQLWQYIEAGLPCQTSGPPVGAYETTFAPLVEAGHEVVCITLTGAHSVTYNSAWSAAQAFSGRVTVIDSRTISVAYGVLVLEAARLAEGGADLPTIVAAVKDMRARTQVRFFLETLEQVQRGGRLDALMPVLNRLGHALNIRAVLTINDEGRISLVGPARGRRGAIRRLIQDAVATLPVEQLVVAHARRPAEANALADQLAGQMDFPRDEVLLAELGTVLIAHAGEGTLAAGTVRRK